MDNQNNKNKNKNQKNNKQGWGYYSFYNTDDLIFSVGFISVYAGKQSERDYLRSVFENGR